MGVLKDKTSGIWLMVFWCIWRYRNHIVFNRIKPFCLKLGLNIKVKIWKWSCVDNIFLSKYNFYDFSQNSVDN